MTGAQTTERTKPNNRKDKAKQQKGQSQTTERTKPNNRDTMMSNAVLTLLLVCSSALWVTKASNAEASAPQCNFMLEIPLVDSSLSEGIGDINSRSLSPWSWRSNTVKDRMPSTLWEAECSSTSCSAPNSGHDLNSLPIYQDVLVLNRQEGTHCYVASYQSVAVGCTCVRAAQRH